MDLKALQAGGSWKALLAGTLRTTRGRLIAAFVMTAVGALVAYGLTGRPTLRGTDDATITFVYARNIADGYGFVYTPGFERVEGSSSLLWTLLCSLPFHFSRSPESAILVVAFALCVFSVATSLNVLRLLFAENRSSEARALLIWGVSIAMLVLGAPAFFAWNTFALVDMAIWTALIQFAVLLLVRESISDQPSPRRRFAFAAVVSLLVVTRPEAMLLAPAMVGISKFCAPPHLAGLRKRLQYFSLATAACLLTMIALTIFRRWYFGFTLPNTYYAKVSPDTSYNLGLGLKYLAVFLTTTCPWASIPIVSLAGVIVVAFRKVLEARQWPSSVLRPQERGLLTIALVLAVGLALPFPSGGDHFPGSRFYQPFLPLLLPGVVHLWLGFDQDARTTRRLAHMAGVVAIVIGAVTWLEYGKTGGPLLAHPFAVANRGREWGMELNAMLSDLPSPPSVGVTAAGGVGMTFNGRAVDVLGLNWVSMGHSPGDRKGLKDHSAFDASVLLASPPDLFCGSITPPAEATLASLTLECVCTLTGHIIDEPRFRNVYVIAERSVGDRVLMGTFRRAWLQQGTHSTVFREVEWPPGPMCR